MRAQGTTTEAGPVRTVEEQRSDRPQDAGALRVAGGAGPSASLARLDDVLDIACGSPTSIWPRGACNAALSGFSAPCQQPVLNQMHPGGVEYREKVPGRS